MNVEIGAEAAQFPEKEYINVIAVAVSKLRKALFFGDTALSGHLWTFLIKCL
jgi:hypothetical protein